MSTNFKRFLPIIFMALLFILQTANLIWCLTEPTIGEVATVIAAFCDGFLLGLLFCSITEL